MCFSAVNWYCFKVFRPGLETVSEQRAASACSTNSFFDYAKIAGESERKAKFQKTKQKDSISIGNSMSCSDIWYKYHE